MAPPLSHLDLAALVFFLGAWLAYEPVLHALTRGRMINSDMTRVRHFWMTGMARRDNRLLDGQLLGHALNSASFFASSNLILIAASAGALFGGERSFASASSLILVHTSSRALFELQVGLVVICLARGLLAFIWSIRQINYCLAVLGAAPENLPREIQDAYGDAAGRLLNPALSAFNAGVRAYYFALAAAAWLFGAPIFIAVTLGAVALLVWRQKRSPASAALAEIRGLLENQDKV